MPCSHMMSTFEDFNTSLFTWHLNNEIYIFCNRQTILALKIGYRFFSFLLERKFEAEFTKGFLLKKQNLMRFLKKQKKNLLFVRYVILIYFNKGKKYCCISYQCLWSLSELNSGGVHPFYFY